MSPRLFTTAKDIAFIGIIVASMIAGQIVFAAVAGVEIVTVLFLSFCVAYGVRRGMIAGTVFSLLRCMWFGFVLNVVVVYILYYNLFAVIFGLVGGRSPACCAVLAALGGGNGRDGMFLVAGRSDFAAHSRIVRPRYARLFLCVFAGDGHAVGLCRGDGGFALVSAVRNFCSVFQTSISIAFLIVCGGEKQDFTCL